MIAFNYSTGPVALSASVVRALTTTETSSHMPAAQEEVARTMASVRNVLDLPGDWIVTMLPGSIRQAIDAAIRGIVGPGDRATVVVEGYWGEFVAQRLEDARACVQRLRVDDAADESRETPAVVAAVHVETEYGEVLRIEEILARAKARGAVTLVDAACSVPADHLDVSNIDLLVLGSHKLLGGAAGLGIICVAPVMVDRLTGPTAPWGLAAYTKDAVQKAAFLAGRADAPSGPPPLVTYPIQVVAALRAALDERTRLALGPAQHEAAARSVRAAAAAVGLVPYAASAPSSAVIRCDVPKGISVERLRRGLLDRGFFVIGNVGSSAGGSIRIGTMSAPQLDPTNIARFRSALAETVNTLS